jgi:hypothetical protein
MASGFVSLGQPDIIDPDGEAMVPASEIEVGALVNGQVDGSTLLAMQIVENGECQPVLERMRDDG